MSAHRNTKSSGSNRPRSPVPLYLSNEMPVLFWLAAMSVFGVTGFVGHLVGAPYLLREILTLVATGWAGRTTIVVYRGLGHGLITQCLVTVPPAGLLLWMIVGGGSEVIGTLAMMGTLGIIAISGSRFSESKSKFMTIESSGVSPSEELDTPGLVDKTTYYESTFYDHGGTAGANAVKVGRLAAAGLAIVGAACLCAIGITGFVIWSDPDYWTTSGALFGMPFVALLGASCAFRSSDVFGRLES